MKSRFLSIPFFILLGCQNTNKSIEKQNTTIEDTNANFDTKYLKVETIEKGDFEFPYVVSTNQKVQQKINYLIQLRIFEQIKEKEKDLFKKLAVKDGENGGIGISYSSFEIKNNSQNCLSILIFIEGCGANCTTVEHYFNFNPLNGNRYSLQDFFSTDNFKKLQKNIVDIRTKSIKKDILKAKKEGEIEDTEYFEEYIFEFIKKDNLEDFYFTKDSIYLSFENSISRMDKLIGIESTTKISINEIKELFNEAGISLLLKQKVSTDIQSNYPPQLYEGTINNKYPIYFTFWNTYEKEYSAIYAYKNVKDGILFSGQETNGLYNFKQDVFENDNGESFVFKLTNQKLNGTWTNIKKQKFSFDVSQSN